MRTGVARASAGLFLIMLGVIAGGGQAAGQVPSLSDTPVPRPPNLGEFIRDEEAAKALGKALFWDMQVGSDGVQACATCHFRAGADPRKKNQVSPGLLRVVFQRDGTARWSRFLTPTTASTARGPTVRFARRTFPSGGSPTPRTASRPSSRTRTT